MLIKNCFKKESSLAQGKKVAERVADFAPCKKIAAGGYEQCKKMAGGGCEQRKKVKNARGWLRTTQEGRGGFVYDSCSVPTDSPCSGLKSQNQVKNKPK